MMEKYVYKKWPNYYEYSLTSKYSYNRGDGV